MNNFSDRMIDKANMLQKRIEKDQQIIVFSKFLDQKKIYKECLMLSHIEITIKQCLQLGNYKRAAYLISISNKILDVVELHEKEITNKITNLILK